MPKKRASGIISASGIKVPPSPQPNSITRAR